ncbi:GNAT family N-acetyltransferase, partial [Mesorhizobium sp. USDA-HM6]
MPRTIRVLASQEVEMLVDWAAGEGWNPGFGDAAVFQAADPEGFIGAFVDGQMVAGISAVAYGDRFGFIGLYICRPDRRGEGHGKAVWDAGMARLGNRTIGLD